MATRTHRRVADRLLGVALAAACSGFAGAAPLSAADCRAQVFEELRFTICEVRAERDEVRIWHRDADGTPLGGFAAIDAMLAPAGEVLSMAMNAGMYHPDRRAVGLLIIDGQEEARIVTRAGTGNFGMLPNAVFCVTDGGFAVIESVTFAADPPPCRHASQSGPMLVIDGALHPRFIRDSASRLVRNGVGTSADGQTAWFAISDKPVNFDEFARLFRDGLGAANALYFDGNVSRLHAPMLRRSDWGLQMGPVVGTVVPAD